MEKPTNKQKHNIKFRFKSAFILLYVLGAAIRPFQLFAQDFFKGSQRVYQNFRAENSSLLSNTIYRIDKGADNYIWISTNKGLFQYNGNSFIPINTGISNKDLVGTYKTSNNWLLLLFYNGNTRAFDLNKQKLINTDSIWGLDKLESNNRPYLFACEEQGKIILSKKARWLNQLLGAVIDPQKNTIINSYIETYVLQNFKAYIDTLSIGGLDNIYGRWSVNSSHLQYNDNVFICDNKIFDRHRKSLLFDGNIFLKNTTITSAEKDNYGIWIGSLNSGLFYIADSTLGKKSFSPKAILDYPISCIMKDYMGNIWVSTLTNGIFIFRKSDAGTLYYPTDAATKANRRFNLRKKRTFNFVYSDKSDFWAYETEDNMPQEIAPRNKAHTYTINPNVSFNTYDINLNKFNFFTSHNFPKHYVQFLAQNKFIYPWKDAYNIGDTANIFSLEAVMKLHGGQAPKNYNFYEKYKIDNILTGLVFSEAHNLLGTSKGLFVNGKKLKWLEDATFYRIRKNGNSIIICTNMGTYCVSLNAITNPSAYQLLSSNDFNNINIDEHYWYLNNEKKIEIFDKNTNKKITEHFFLDFTIPFESINCFIDNQHIVFLSHHGLFFFLKKTLLNNKSITPKAYIYNTQKGYTTNDSVLSIKYAKNKKLSFKIDVLDYNKESKTIKYRLYKNGEEIGDWTNYKENSEITLFKLSPGEYDIGVNILSATGSWKKNINFHISILPEWYQTWWAKLFLLLSALVVLTMLIYILVSNQQKKQTRKNEDKIRKLELEAQSLHAQINPHFIFNAIIPFQEYVLKNDTKNALSYVNKFSKLIRAVLNNSRSKTVSIQNELSFLKNYLDIQQKRFENKFDYTFIIDEDINTQLHIPTLFLQPIVENAIDHGVFDIPRKGEIIIHFKSGNQEDSIEVNISDNGNGIELPFIPRKNHVLEIIIERLALMKKNQGVGSIEIKNTQQYGALITIILPTFINQD